MGQLSGHGTSAQSQAYSYSDPNLTHYASNTVYYRLRQVAENQQSTYLPVRVLTDVQAAATALLPALQLAPNPGQVGSKVLVQATGPEPVQLLSVQGQVLASVQPGTDGNVELPVANLAAGVYIVRSGTHSTRLLLSN